MTAPVARNLSLLVPFQTLILSNGSAHPPLATLPSEASTTVKKHNSEKARPAIVPARRAGYAGRSAGFQARGSSVCRWRRRRFDLFRIGDFRLARRRLALTGHFRRFSEHSGESQTLWRSEIEFELSRDFRNGQSVAPKRQVVDLLVPVYSAPTENPPL